MGLDAYVEGGGGGRVGSYGWFHSFRHVVCGELEGGRRGSRFPLLQDHSDCEGGYSPEQAMGLAAELAEIRRGLKKARYPAYRRLDAEGRELGTALSYAGGRTSGNEIHGYGVGVDKRGIKVVRKRRLVGHFVEIVRGDGHDVGIKRDGGRVTLRPCGEVSPRAIDAGTGLSWGTPRRLMFITVGADEVFKDVIDLLEGLCADSARTGNPIVFC